MRFVHVTIPEGERRAVERVLADHGIDYAVTDEVGGVDRRPDGREYEAVATFPLPVEAVEPVVASLREIGLDEESHVVVQTVQTVVSDRFGELQREYDERTSDEHIAHEEIRMVAKGLVPDRLTYVLLSVASAVVATAGLLLDSASIVVGSMVIAPLIGPALSASVGTVLADRELTREGVTFQVLGFGLAVASATAFALVVRTFFLVPPNVDVTAIEQISGRLSPDLLSLVVALGSGAAGARSLTGDISTPLVGVMVAAALIPPTAAIGIGIAWGLPAIVLRAGLLVLVNTLSINLMALATLWLSGYRAHGERERRGARRRVHNWTVVIAVAVLVLAAILGAFTYSAYRAGASTESVRATAQEVVDSDRYADLTLTEVTVEYGDEPFSRTPTRVVVTVTAPGGEIDPDLDDDIETELRRTAGVTVPVTVRFIPVSTAGGNATATPAGTGTASTPRAGTGASGVPNPPGARRLTPDRLGFMGEGPLP
ncbi:TIGR00341 family protein [Halosimplex halophilum]|uniref:TIGR00341 family protein n=1 Tax=Halosimplex halophilum TaxID=2559572 RepID=UPI00107F8D66|nr:TIGR00341 family protein [Halosimplex halophilum]